MIRQGRCNLTEESLANKTKRHPPATPSPLLTSTTFSIIPSYSHQLCTINSFPIAAESRCPSVRALHDFTTVQQQPRPITDPQTPDILTTTNHLSYSNIALMASTTSSNGLKPYAYQKPSTLATRTLVTGEKPIDNKPINHYEEAVRAAGQNQPKNETTGRTPTTS